MSLDSRTVLLFIQLSVLLNIMLFQVVLDDFRLQIAFKITSAIFFVVARKGNKIMKLNIVFSELIAVFHCF